jgi:hypothetical protein
LCTQGIHWCTHLWTQSTHWRTICATIYATKEPIGTPKAPIGAPKAV